MTKPQPGDSTVESFRRWGAHYLVHSTWPDDAPDSDAIAAIPAEVDFLLAGVLGKTRAELILSRESVIDPAAVEKVLSAFHRKKLGEPVAYILSHHDFFGRTFEVSRDVLIPRPETELLLEHVLRRFQPSWQRYFILDAGTGSGALLVSAACEVRRKFGEEVFRRGTFTGVDISRPALAVACRNAARHGCEGLNFLCGDLFNGLSLRDFSSPSIIMANLPYIPESHALPRSVAEYEPALALRSGVAGLDAIQRAIESLREISGEVFALFEIGMGQHERVVSFFHDAGFTEVSVIPDLAGIERIVAARKVVRA